MRNPIRWIKEWWQGGKARDRFIHTANTESILLVQLHKDYLAAVEGQGKQSLHASVLRDAAKRQLEIATTDVANALLAIPDSRITEEIYELYEGYCVITQSLAEEIDK